MPPGPFIGQSLRKAGLESISCLVHVFIAPPPPTLCIAREKNLAGFTYYSFFYKLLLLPLCTQRYTLTTLLFPFSANCIMYSEAAVLYMVYSIKGSVALPQYTQSGNGPIFGEHSTMMEKSGGGVHAHPLSLYVPLRTKCMFQLRGQKHSVLFLIYPYMYYVVAIFFIFIWFLPAVLPSDRRLCLPFADSLCNVACGALFCMCKDCRRYCRAHALNLS
jgi:hypothetical protein